MKALRLVNSLLGEFCRIVKTQHVPVMSGKGQSMLHQPFVCFTVHTLAHPLICRGGVVAPVQNQPCLHCPVSPARWPAITARSERSRYLARARSASGSPWLCHSAAPWTRRFNSQEKKLQSIGSAPHRRTIASSAVREGGKSTIEERTDSVDEGPNRSQLHTLSCLYSHVTCL